MTRQERAAYLLETFRGHPWLRALREDGRPYVDLTREDCELIADLLRVASEVEK
jgi:hypothetical protein